MDCVFKIKPIGQARSFSYGYTYNELEDAMENMYFHFLNFAKQEPDVAEAKVEFRVCPDKYDDTEITIFKCHIRFKTTKKKDKIKKIEILSYESTRELPDATRCVCNVDIIEHSQEGLYGVYPTVLKAIQDMYDNLNNCYEELDTSKALDIKYYTNTRKLFEARIKLIYEEKRVKEVAFVSVRSIPELKLNQDIKEMDELVQWFKDRDIDYISIMKDKIKKEGF